MPSFLHRLEMKQATRVYGGRMDRSWKSKQTLRASFCLGTVAGILSGVKIINQARNVCGIMGRD